MRSISGKAPAVGAILLVLTLILAACGSAPQVVAPTQPAATVAPPADATVAPPADATVAPPADATVAPTSAAAAPTTTGASGGRTLTVGMRELVSSFDYPYDWNIASTWIHSNIGDCLVWRDRATAEFVPWLAESYEKVNDTTWRMKLRQGVTFHNGEPFNAEAVKYTIDRIAADEKALVYNQWTFLKEVKIIDEANVEFATTGPEPAFLSKMAGTGCQVVPPKYTEQVGSAGFSTAPIGTGPFKFVEWVKDDRITLEANPDYFGGAPGIDTLIFRAVPEDSTRVAELLTGGVDLVVSVPIQDWERVQADTNLALDNFLTTQVMLLALRGGPSSTLAEFTGVTTNSKIRQAIAYAIDRKAIVELIGGMGVPTLTRVTPPTLGSNPDLYDKAGEYNPDRARELLKEAGYNGEPLVFHSAPAQTMQKEVTEAIVAMLEEVGLKIDLQFMELTTFREQIYAPRKNLELYMDALGNTFFDPWIAVQSERSDQRQRSGWAGAEADQADKLIREAAVNMDPEARSKQYQELQTLLTAENGGPYVYLYRMKDTLARNKRVNYAAAPDGFLWFGKASVQP
ncbi:MAG: hypothetical protein H7Y32_05415 [Chloroflexales bacterium]|nr:hypothetical protein [Chloroflexales bacterium]